MAEQLTVLGQYPDVEIGHQDQHPHQPGDRPSPSNDLRSPFEDHVEGGADRALF